MNFVADYRPAMAFFGNQKRYSRLREKRNNRDIIVSSNVRPDSSHDYVVNYHSLINRGYKYFENSTIMLFNLLKRTNPSKITIAGFDGFAEQNDSNYMDTTYQNERHINEFSLLNQEIRAMFADIVEVMRPSCIFEMMTPSLYKDIIK